MRAIARQRVRQFRPELNPRTFDPDVVVPVCQIECEEEIGQGSDF